MQVSPIAWRRCRSSSTESSWSMSHQISTVCVCLHFFLFSFLFCLLNRPAAHGIHALHDRHQHEEHRARDPVCARHDSAAQPAGICCYVNCLWLFEWFCAGLKSSPLSHTQALNDFARRPANSGDFCEPACKGESGSSLGMWRCE